MTPKEFADKMKNIYKLLIRGGEMFTLGVIPNWAEKQLICGVCGTDKSVKYTVRSNGAVVPCCNKCAFSYFRGVRKENNDGT